jgi:RNA polymerase sigma-70 factor (ECF subfamily)
MTAAIANLGDRRRFERLVGALRTDLYRYALWLARDPQLAEDVVQESMLRAWRSFVGLEDEAKARPWLVTIVRREFLRLREKQREESVDPDFFADMADLSDAGEDPMVGELRTAIFALEENYREPLVLQVLMGHSTSEIAEILGVSQGAILTRLHRAREKLKESLLAADAGTEERQ